MCKHITTGDCGSCCHLMQLQNELVNEKDTVRQKLIRKAINNHNRGLEYIPINLKY